MAFNPLSNFHKYRQFWMASVLLLTMITFVLCSGTKGDLADRLLGWFGRGSGTKILSLGGSNYTDLELQDLRNRRKLASLYMQKASDVNRQSLLQSADNVAASAAAATNATKEELQQMADTQYKLRAAAYLLHQRAKKVNFFDSGTSFEEMVDFLVWLKEADRLGIYLDDNDVKYLVNRELYAADAQFSARDSLYIFAEARNRVGGLERATESTLFQALRDEFRVQLAQQAAMKSPSFMKNQVNFPIDLPSETRIPLTPNQLFEYYQKNRGQIDITLFPIEVSDFVKRPTDKDLPKFFKDHHDELSAFFEKFKRQQPDPASPDPGFEIPARIKAAWVSADPNSEQLKTLSNIEFLLEITSPWSVSPSLGLAAWVRPAAAQPLKDHVLDLSFFGELKGKKPSFSDVAFAAGWDQTDLLTALVKYRGTREPLTLAAWVGQGAMNSIGSLPEGALASMLATAHARHGGDQSVAMLEESRRRAPVFATLPGLGATGSPLAILGIVHGMKARPSSMEDKLLPSAAFRPEGLNKLLAKTARDRAVDTMVRLRELLEKNKGQPTQRALEIALNQFKTAGLEQKQTEKFHDRYTIAGAPELAPLLNSFKRNYHIINLVEGRTGNKALKETDFYKLFEPGESFAVTQKFDPKPWPPDLRVMSSPLDRNEIEKDLLTGGPIPKEALPFYRKQIDFIQSNNLKPVETVFHLFSLADGKPFLFWKTDEQKATFPPNLEAAKDQVIDSWLFSQARDTKAWPKAKAVAESLQNVFGDFEGQLTKLSKELGREPIRLRDVARLVPEETWLTPSVNQTIYEPYKLPPGTIPFPRDDTAANLLNLYQLKEPFQAKIEDFKELDEFNKQLFETMSKAPKDLKGNQFVQIITNKPRTAFYVAVVTTNHPQVDREQFFQAWADSNDYGPLGQIRFNAQGPVGPANTLSIRAHEKAAREFRQAIVAQLRQSLKYQAFDVETTRKNFDQSDSN